MFDRTLKIIMLFVMLIATTHSALSQTKKVKVNDVASIPYIGEFCRTLYRKEFLSQEFHRAFSVAKNGACGAAYNYRTRGKAEYQSLINCKPYSQGTECRIYAVNGSVVWNFE